MRNWTRLAGLALASWAALNSNLHAADWNQWRGPGRDGTAAASPPLAESWPKAGPVKLWQSEKIPSNNAGGLGSPVVADGKVYLYANWQYIEPIATCSSPAFADGRLYLRLGGAVACYDLSAAANATQPAAAAKD